MNLDILYIYINIFFFWEKFGERIDRKIKFKIFLKFTQSWLSNNSLIIFRYILNLLFEEYHTYWNSRSILIIILNAKSFINISLRWRSTIINGAQIWRWQFISVNWSMWRQSNPIKGNSFEYATSWTTCYSYKSRPADTCNI